MEEGEFLAIVRENAPKGEPICLEPDTVITLTSAVKLHRHDKLIVRGGIIQGFCHSLFQIDCNSNKQIALTLENVRLNHTMVHEDRRQVGAAVFVMSKAVVSLIGCTFTSTAGFGIWAKHDSSITVKDCSIDKVGRSAIVCFNNAKISVEDTTIKHASVHGVCLRGKSTITLNRVTVSDCKVRGVYVYQQGTLEMYDCQVFRIMDPESPAVHAEASGPDDVVHFTMISCNIAENAGADVLIVGNVVENLEENTTGERRLSS
eukprot:m.68037 g.68037  ORF g.68037 m.68037 type:complete len:261 (+) comp11934_c0_seq2:37-819(+)